MAIQLQVPLNVAGVKKLSFLDVTEQHRHPWCGNAEGWGPLSCLRFDFTPCFLDVWICLVSLFGIVFGGSAIWWLLKRSKPRSVPRDWHFYAKLVGAPSFSLHREWMLGLIMGVSTGPSEQLGGD